MVGSRVRSSAPQPALVLVVDDDEDNRVATTTALEAAGHRVVIATGGEEAIAAFATETPDCILLDVRMPGLDGFGACQRIRGLPHGADTPVIFLTALRDIDTFDRALLAGGDDFLSKPVRAAELLVRVQSALKLRRMSAELREHYDLLKQQRDALQRVQLQKERLMAFVVHDLKNPVSAMDLHAQVLLRAEGLTPFLRDSATQIRTEARQLTRMITDLLDLSKADEGRLVPQLARVDLASLAAEVASELGVTARSMRVELACAVTAAPVRADEDLLRRALTNLVDNALRHAPPGSTVTIAATTDGEGTLVRVLDGGDGIAAELRVTIFEPFVQLGTGSSPPSTRTGRGLGLAFCKLVAEAHLGKIWVEDNAPGAVFCLRLPPAA